jgi:hypothetical protein
MICKIFVSLIAPKGEDVILVTLESSEPGKIVNEVTLEIGKDGLAALSSLDQNKLSLGCSLLNEMGGIYNTVLVVEIFDGKVNSLRVVCRSQ